MKRDASLRHGAAATLLNQQPHQLVGQEGGDSGRRTKSRTRSSAAFLGRGTSPRHFRPLTFKIRHVC